MVIPRETYHVICTILLLFVGLLNITSKSWMFFASFPLKFSGRNVLIRRGRSADLLILPAWSRFTPWCVCVQLWRLFQHIFVSLKAIKRASACSRTTSSVTSPSNYWLPISSITRGLWYSWPGSTSFPFLQGCDTSAGSVFIRRRSRTWSTGRVWDWSAPSRPLSQCLFSRWQCPGASGP